MSETNKVQRWELVEIGPDNHKRTEMDHDDNNGSWVTYEDYAALQEQLTATTNSLTNAQEALKSAGIEADTVQAGVMELLSRMNRLGRENVALMNYIQTEHLHNCVSTGTGTNTTPSPETNAFRNNARAKASKIVAALLRAGNAGKDGSHD